MKKGKIGVNMGGGKGEEQRRVPGVLPRAHRTRREGKYEVAAHILCMQGIPALVISI